MNGYLITGLAVACAAFTLSTPAAAALLQGQDFESYANGASQPWLMDVDPPFGYFSGGTVQQPGVSIGGQYALAGSRVYVGADILYTNVFPGPYHCCGFGRMEMLVNAPNGVTIEYYGHANMGGTGQEFFDQVLMFSETLFGSFIMTGWGSPLVFEEGNQPPGGGNSDIMSIRWTSLDGSLIAIDNVEGVGGGYVPEPATWAMLITGFGLTGIALRRQRRALA